MIAEKNLYSFCNKKTASYMSNCGTFTATIIHTVVDLTKNGLGTKLQF